MVDGSAIGLGQYLLDDWDGSGDLDAGTATVLHVMP